MSQEKPWLETALSFEDRAKHLLSEMTLDEKLSQLNYMNKAIPRLGMKAYVWWNEALHGLARSGTGTCFPQAIAMAATFSVERLKDMAETIALEGRARHHESARQGDYGTYKGLTYWSPNVNIFRDPRWGRGHETYGEDPYLTGVLGETYVKGVQGDHPKFLQAVATPKHYAVHSGPELTRLSFNSVTDERDLRETYLPAFKRCFDAGAQSVMTAYNAINGEPCATNERLMKDILRDEWGFDGAIVTDAGAGEALYKEHKTVADYPEATAKELDSGVDVIVDWEQGVEQAHQRGLLNMESVDRAVYYQLLIKFRLGFFDDEKEVPLSDTPFDVIECESHLEMARQATREALVLMKNKSQLLPLNKATLKNIAVIGPNANSREALLGNYHSDPASQVTVLEGLKKSVGKSARVWYARGCEYLSPRTEPCAEDNDRLAEAVTIAERSDVAILCLGLTPTIEGEAGDTFNSEAGGDRLSIELPEVQENLLKKVLDTGTPVIVLMMTGSAVISPNIEERVDGLLHCWYPGAEAGDAIAETLFGENNPSGRLPVTFYKSTDDLPNFEDYSMKNRTYRFFNGEAAYPFGYGLSYTTFAYSDLTLEKVDGGFKAKVSVRNTGDRDGLEVVQVYSSQKHDERTPKRSLVAFQKVHCAAGQTQVVELFIEEDQIKITDDAGVKQLVSGEVLFSVGGSQPDERSITLMGREVLNQSITLA